MRKILLVFTLFFDIYNLRDLQVVEYCLKLERCVATRDHMSPSAIFP